MLSVHKCRTGDTTALHEHPNMMHDVVRSAYGINRLLAVVEIRSPPSFSALRPELRSTEESACFKAVAKSHTKFDTQHGAGAEVHVGDPRYSS